MKTFALVGILVGLTVTTPLLAQPARPKPPPAAKEPAPKEPAPPPAPPAAPSLADTLSGTAKAAYESGKLLYGDGDYAGALLKFRAAYDESKDARLLWNVAACEKNLRHYASVLSLVRQYLDEGATTLSPADKSEAETLLTTIEPFTAALEAKVSEEGARVYVDDALVGTTPLAKPVVVDIGVRKVRVQKDDFEELVKEIPVGGGPKITIEVTLKKIIHEGRLVVTARPGQQIFIDGAPRGIGSFSGAIASGGHSLRVSAPEMRTYQSEIVLRDNESRTVSVTLDREPKAGGAVPAWVWIGGGALLVSGLVVGGIILFQPEDRKPDLPVGNIQPGAVQASIPFR